MCFDYSFPRTYEEEIWMVELDAGGNDRKKFGNHCFRPLKKRPFPAYIAQWIVSLAVGTRVGVISASAKAGLPLPLYLETVSDIINRKIILKAGHNGLDLIM